MRLPFQRPRAEPALPPHGGDDALQAARTQARRRLAGALVLLVAGVIGFPILFETQPRPVAGDMPIATPARTSGAPATPGATGSPVPTPRRDTVPEPVAEPAAAAEPAVAPKSIPPGGDVAAAAPVAPGDAARRDADAAALSTSVPAAPAKPAAAARPAATSVPAETTKPAAPAAAAKPAAEPPAAATGRFVVQVGAYTDAGTLRDTRSKVEKLGLKTYTQVLESAAGRRTRLRVGPFATRAEAQAAAARLKGAGLPAAILAL